MTPKGKLYKKEYAVELLRIAQGDLDSAKILLMGTGGRLENVCYLAQQAAEKALKAILCHCGKPLTHTHDMEALLALLPAGHIPPDAFLLRSLTEYATIRRYEEGYEILTPEDLQSVVKVAENVVQWATQRIVSRPSA